MCGPCRGLSTPAPARNRPKSFHWDKSLGFCSPGWRFPARNPRCPPRSWTPPRAWLKFGFRKIFLWRPGMWTGARTRLWWRCSMDTPRKSPRSFRRPPPFWNWARRCCWWISGGVVDPRNPTPASASKKRRTWRRWFDSLAMNFPTVVLICLDRAWDRWQFCARSRFTGLRPTG